MLKGFYSVYMTVFCFLTFIVQTTFTEIMISSFCLIQLSQYDSYILLHKPLTAPVYWYFLVVLADYFMLRYNDSIIYYIWLYVWMVPFWLYLYCYCTICLTNNVYISLYDKMSALLFILFVINVLTAFEFILNLMIYFL